MFVGNKALLPVVSSFRCDNLFHIIFILRDFFTSQKQI